MIGARARRGHLVAAAVCATFAAAHVVLYLTFKE